MLTAYTVFPVLLIILASASLIGYRVISAVPSLLHTPLMSGMNALSGITVLGALAVLVTAPPVVRPLAGLAVVLAMINVVGGFWVTERMLRMFQPQDALTENNSDQKPGKD